MAVSIVGVIAIVACALVRDACGMKATPVRVADVDDDLDVPRNATRRERLGALAEFKAFEYMWEYRHATEPSLDKELPSGLKIVFGVTTMRTAAMDEYWAVIKKTWMQQRGVCKLPEPPRELPGCTVYVTRVVGTVPRLAQDDPWQLNMTENMNDGKTFEMFRTLSRGVSWATHIAKVDMDAYPYVYRLVSQLQSRQGCAARYQFMGAPLTFKWDPKPYQNCNLPQDNMQKLACYLTPPSNGQCGDDDLGCLSYMLGGMYVLSRPLAEDITSDGGFFSSNKVGHEDRQMGMAVRNYIISGTGMGECISLFSHHNSWHHNFQVELDPRDPGRSDFTSKRRAQKFNQKADWCAQETRSRGETPAECAIPARSS